MSGEYCWGKTYYIEEACVALLRGPEGESLAKVYGWRSDFTNYPALLRGRMAGLYTHAGFPGCFVPLLKGCWLLICCALLVALQ